MITGASSGFGRFAAEHLVAAGHRGDGHDAAQKLAILASLAFRSRVPCEAIFRQGIAELHPLDLRFARELGYVVKLLGQARLVEGTDASAGGRATSTHAASGGTAATGGSQPKSTGIAKGTNGDSSGCSCSLSGASNKRGTTFFGLFAIICALVAARRRRR